MPRPDSAPVRVLSQRFDSLQRSLAGVVRGKPEAIELLTIGLLAAGHVLIEDVPGVGKTLLGLALARSVDCGFRRIQFTNDTLPSDILGAVIYARQEERFRFVPGPIFGGVVLADEINRASPKTQSALLEAMTERQVTVENESHPLPEPFFVIATQNPLDYHGTFPLPESQLDRFLLRFEIGYPSLEAEREILKDDIEAASVAALPVMLGVEDIRAARLLVREVHVEESVADYLLAIVRLTREEKALGIGASPRAALALKHAAQARAFLKGRAFVLPDDIKTLALPVLAHRMRLARAGADAPRAAALLGELVGRVAVPV